MDGKVDVIRKITMEKNKNFLIFTNNLFPYKISYDLNSGKYYKIHNNISKEIKSIKPFFAHVSYKNIINKEDFPVYNEIIKMAASTSYGSNIFNMGTVLDLLKKHIFWEQYLTLNLPVTKDMEYPLTFFPKDILEVLKRSFLLKNTYEEECIRLEV